MATVESLEYVVRGDTKEYVAALRASAEATRASAGAITGQLSQIAGQFNALAASAGGLSSALSGALGAAGVGGLKDMLGAFASMDEVSARLAASIEAGGHAVAETLADYKAFAAQMAETTTVARGTTMSLLAQAEAMGLSGAAAERAVRNAAGLAAARGGSAGGYILQTVALEEGRPEMLQRRLLPQIRGIHDEGLKAARAQELLAGMFKLAEARAGTFAGQTEQLKNSLAGLKAELGAVAAEGAGPLVSAAQGAVQWFRELDDTDKRLLVGALAAVGGLAALRGAIGLTAVAATALVGSLAAAGRGVAALSALALGTPAGFALTVGAAMVAAAAYESKIGEREAKERQSRLDAIRAHFAAEVEAQQAESKAALEGALGRGTPQEQRAEVEALIKDQAVHVEGLKKDLADAEARAERVYRGRSKKSEVDEARADAEGLRSQLAFAERAAVALREALLKLQAPWEKPRLKEDLANLGRSLDDQIALFGLEGPHRKVAEMKRRGMREEDVLPERQKADALDVMKEWAQLEKALESLDAELEKQAALFGKAAYEAKLYDLALLGASEGEIALRRAALRRAEATKEAQAAQDAAAQALGRLGDELSTFGMTPGEKAFRELYEQTGSEAAANQARNLTAQFEAMKTAMEVALPADKVAAGMRSLDEQYVRGGLSAEAYTRAVLRLRQGLEGLGGAVEAMDIRGADAAALIQKQYLQGLAPPVELPARRAPWRGGEAPGAMPGAGGAYALPEAPGDFANPYGAPGGGLDKTNELLRNLLDETRRQGKLPELRVLGVDLLG